MLNDKLPTNSFDMLPRISWERRFEMPPSAGEERPLYARSEQCMDAEKLCCGSERKALRPQVKDYAYVT